MHFAPNPGATCVDRLPRPRVVPRLAFKEVENMLSTRSRPLREQTVIYICQTAPPSDSDQSRVAHLRQDRHSIILRWPRSLRFAERLYELADFAAGLHPLTGEDVTTAVSSALRRTASDLMGYVEAV
jgi:hypothetical protein